ncbi:TPA: cytidylate kinase family protein [Clostridioides difficile]|nr:cytidylate kinase family protein [Clostridioides difficile]
MIRDIVCFIPLIIIFPAIFGGVEAILYAAPVADFIAMIVATFITIKFFKSLEKYTPEKTEYSVILKSKPGFIVTIAREHGSSGKQIGKIIAEKLNIPFYYKEVTALAAQESGLDKEFISDINRNSPKHLHELYLSTNVIQQAVVAQDQIIKKIAENGSCVIVGRAADYVLNGHADMIRIFIYASKEYKISRIMEIYGDSSEEAENNIRRADEARATYYKNISGNQWGQHSNYDLLINSSIGIEKTANIILQYIASKQNH